MRLATTTLTELYSQSWNTSSSFLVFFFFSLTHTHRNMDEGLHCLPFLLKKNENLILDYFNYAISTNPTPFLPHLYCSQIHGLLFIYCYTHTQIHTHTVHINTVLGLITWYWITYQEVCHKSRLISLLSVFINCS